MKVEFTKKEMESITVAVSCYFCEGYTFEWLSNGGASAIKVIKNDKLYDSILGKLEALNEK